ncbi:MAG: HAD-IIIC family phosphatase [Terriglobales bacterium]
MKFLEAHRILATFRGGEPFRFLLAMSGTSSPLDFYSRAVAAERGRTAEVHVLPFGTLGQWLMQIPNASDLEVALLFPWDFIPEVDWRTGLPARTHAPEALRQGASRIAKRLQDRGAGLLYVPAQIPPLLLNTAENVALSAWLTYFATSIGADIIPESCFSLSTYLASGSPITGSSMGRVAEAIVGKALAAEDSAAPEPYKVLVTDFDNTIWAGVVAEDGPEGICCLSEGAGYPHFVYQTFLAKLKREGTLLAAVSRNEFESAVAPLRAGRMQLGENDFVSIKCTYGAKSVEIQALADNLGLGLESFVFVDDNPVELAEVAAALPKVCCLQFPHNAEELPRLLAEIRRRFSRKTLTDEDSHRTELYRLRSAAQALRVTHINAEGADLTEFLHRLEMKLVVHDRTQTERTRAVQLINKTNQFNLNGVRLNDDAIQNVLNGGGRLYGASLTDRSGNHGEILACLIAPEGTILSLVLSCRVFQRRVEYAFLAWLANRIPAEVRMRFQPTGRNDPFRAFLEDPAFLKGAGGEIVFDAASFSCAHRTDLELFELTTEI